MISGTAHLSALAAEHHERTDSRTRSTLMTLRGEKTLARLERQRAKFRARFAAGQCVHGLCPLPVFRGGRCITHRTRLLQLQRARAAALKRAGICVRCTEEKARRGHVTCAACARVLALKDRERRRRTLVTSHACGNDERKV